MHSLDMEPRVLRELGQETFIMAHNITELPLLRDDLALHRTVLANERTMLAYIRTALTLFAAGVTFVKFFDHSLVVGLGWFMIPVSFATLLKGLISYNMTKREIIRKEQEALDVSNGG